MNEDETVHKKKPKMLIAEDNQGNFLLLNIMLRAYFDIERVYTGIEAINALLEHHFDIVLMDIKMPKMDGNDACKEIRKFNDTIPIFAQTAYAYDYQKEEAMKYGFSSYIIKPIKKVVLFEELKRYGFDVGS